MEELKSNSITMDTLKTSIINAIKTLRSHRKCPDELTVLEFVKKDLQITIKINDITVNLVRLSKIGEIKKKLSNNRTFYYLIDDSTDIMKDVGHFIQNEIRQRINLYSQDEHQTLADKRIIVNLGKEIHFLKNEIETKNKIIKNFIKNNSHRAEKYNVPQNGQFWEFTHISRDSDTNEINTVNRNIDEQLKAIKEGKHK